METRLREAMREGLEAWEYYIVICLWTVAHALTAAQEFLVCFAGSCQRYNTACFLSNTAFRTPDGSFRAVQHLGIGDEVRLTTEQLARITHATKLPRTIQDLVELVTNQGCLRVSANHRIVTTRGPRKAKELQVDDKVLVAICVLILQIGRRCKQAMSSVRGLKPKL